MAEEKRCRDYDHYKPIDDEKGDCFGVEVSGNRDPAESEKCGGKFFKPRRKEGGKVKGQTKILK